MEQFPELNAVTVALKRTDWAVVQLEEAVQQGEAFAPLLLPLPLRRAGRLSQPERSAAVASGHTDSRSAVFWLCAGFVVYPNIDAVNLFPLCFGSDKFAGWYTDRALCVTKSLSCPPSGFLAVFCCLHVA